MLSGVGGTTPTAVPQQDIVGAVQQASTVIGDTATKLATLPPPTFSGGEQVATGVVGAMQSASSQMTTSGNTFAAIDPADAAALQAGRTTLQTELLTSLGFLRDLGKIDPAVTSEIAKIPSCSAVDPEKLRRSSVRSRGRSRRVTLTVRDRACLAEDGQTRPLCQWRLTTSSQATRGYR